MAKGSAKLAPSESAPNKLGQTLGAKGARTRRRIMDATALLVAERPVSEVRITDIARAAQIAQPNFYTYFASVEDVIRELGEEISLEGLARHLDGDWAEADGLARARRLVEDAFALWRRHSAVIGLVWFFADKRQPGFPELRVRQTRGLYKAFEAQVRRSQAAGRLSKALQPRLTGYECIGIVSSASNRYDLLRQSGFSHRHLVETTARLLHTIVTGIAHPPEPARA